MNRSFLLDIDIASELIRLRPEPSVIRWFRMQPETDLYLSVIPIGEIQKGIALTPASRHWALLELWLEDELIPSFEDRLLPITQAIVRRRGSLTADRQHSGRPIGAADGLIAATALEHKLTLATRNTKDFINLAVPLLNPWYVEQ